jgi:hypothetical protein
MRQALVDGGDFFLVAAEAVETLGKDDIDVAGAGPLEELQHSRAIVQVPAADGAVAEHLDDLVAFARRPFPAEPDLILDGGVALQLR